MEELCTRKSFALQPQQEFVSDFLSPATPYDRLLLFHGLGSGKTCAAISIVERWKMQSKIVVILSASLEGNFRNELRSQCPDTLRVFGKTRVLVNPYLTRKERIRLSEIAPGSKEFKEILQRSDKKIDAHYDIMSYEKFATRSRKRDVSFKNRVVIIDEVQNIVSLKGSRYKELIRRIDISPPKRLVLLSATPIFDNPLELALTINLLKVKNERFDLKSFYRDYLVSDKNGKYRIFQGEDLKRRLQGLISYYRGADPRAYPEREDIRLECIMSKFQAKTYWDVAEDFDQKKADLFKMKNNFFIASRSASNIVYPGGGIGAKGMKSATRKMYLGDNIGKYSCKMRLALNIIEKSRGPVFMYSNFVEYAGLTQIANTLESNGFEKFGSPGNKPKFVVFSGKETKAFRDTIVRTYNLPRNRDGSLIKVIIGSPSIKEGISLKRTQTVIMFDPYWNESRMSQVVGRGFRYCSHIDVPKDQRMIKVYFLVACDKKKGKITIDEYLYDLSEKKQKVNDLFETVMREVAIDCFLFKNANQPPNYECFKGKDEMDYIVIPPKEVEESEEKKIVRELRFRRKKIEIINKEDILPLTKYIQKKYKGYPNVKFLVTYVSKYETAELAQRRADSIMLILDTLGLKGKVTVEIQGASKAIFRVGGARKATNIEFTGRVVIPGTKPGSGCPVNRRPDNKGKCPASHPHKVVNSRGYNCCFIHRTRNKGGSNKGRFPGEIEISSRKKKPLKDLQIGGKTSRTMTIEGKLCFGVNYRMKDLEKILKAKNIRLDGRHTKDRMCVAIWNDAKGV